MIEKIKYYYGKIKSVFLKIVGKIKVVFFIIIDPYLKFDAALFTFVKETVDSIVARYNALVDLFYKISSVAYIVARYNAFIDWKESYMSVFDTFDERDFVLYTFVWQSGVYYGVMEYDMDLEIAFWCSLYGFNMSALVWFMWFSKYGR